jgi:hypothetical protein
VDTPQEVYTFTPRFNRALRIAKWREIRVAELLNAAPAGLRLCMRFAELKAWFKGICLAYEQGCLQR